MKLLDLYINGFGKFHNREISFEEGLNIVYGKNEAGKSTIHTFIRGMLFGIEVKRGRAAKNDTYTKFEPWENSGVYEGRLRVSYLGHNYRIERRFQKNKKEIVVVDETIGKLVEPNRAFWDELLCGLSETTYNNTISIGQLKSATDEGMVSELKNYIANLNTSGNMALNITKAATFLKHQRKELESQMVPEAARSYTALLSEIRNVEKEIASPEYENQIQSYQTMRSEMKDLIDQKQQEKESLIQKTARGKQVLASSQFTDQASITSYLIQTQKVYEDYSDARDACDNKSRKVLSILSFIAATLLLCGTGFLFYMLKTSQTQGDYGVASVLLCGGMAFGSLFLYLAGICLILRRRRDQKDLSMNLKVLQEVFSRHLGDSTISQDAMNAFQERMAEFTRLSAAITKSEASIQQQAEEIEELQKKQENCSGVIETQQRTQWELERKLEHLSNCKTQSEALKHVLAENERIRDEISAIELALETMTSLSSSIRGSFGLYLNKIASDLISGITGGIYTSMSVDENLNVFMNTKTRLVPIEQVSSGTMDQVYLALRLAAASLIQGDGEHMPLVFDDSFTLYDDDRLKTALKWLTQTYDGQIVIFTCHQREIQMLTETRIPFHLIEI